jgi:lipopolysaccharide transport system permease protein
LEPIVAVDHGASQTGFPWRSALAEVASDCREALKMCRFAAMLAWRDVTSGVRLSMLGPLWLFAQPLLWIVTIIFFFGPSAGQSEPMYGLYVAAGLTIYLGLQTFVVEGSKVFATERNIILNVRVPFFVFVIKLLIKVLITMLISLPIVLVAIIVNRPPIDASILLVVPALLVLLTAGIGMMLTLGVIGTKYLDLNLMLQALMRVVMFATPIFWIVPEQDNLRHLAAQLNPFYHLIEIIRAPIMGRVPAPEHWLISIAFAVVLLLSGVLLFARYRRRLPLWV